MNAHMTELNPTTTPYYGDTIKLPRTNPGGGWAPITIKVHSHIGDFSISPIIVRNGRNTCARNDELKAAGLPYTHKHYRLHHRITGLRIRDYRTIKACRAAAKYLTACADDIGMNWNTADLQNSHIKQIGKLFAEYNRRNWKDESTNAIEENFPTIVE